MDSYTCNRTYWRKYLQSDKLDDKQRGRKVQIQRKRTSQEGKIGKLPR